jgi:hypothetical protein
MLKLMRVAVVAALMVPAVAQAQSFRAENFSVTLGIGAAVPARDAAFREAAATTFYKLVVAEYKLSDRVGVFGQYDRSKYPIAEGGDWSAVGTGGGLMLFFDLIPENHWTGFIKVGAMKNDLDPGKVDWNAVSGFGADFFAKGSAHGRIGIDLRDLANESPLADESTDPFRIGSVFVYAGVNISPWSLWK